MCINMYEIEGEKLIVYLIPVFIKYNLYIFFTWKF